MDNTYFYHYYIYHGDFLAFRYCQGTKQQSYTARIVRTLPIVLPSTIHEQRAIATVLSDMDSLIASLNQLIAKKRDLNRPRCSNFLPARNAWPGYWGVGNQIAW